MPKVIAPKLEFDLHIYPEKLTRESCMQKIGI
jgi:hypothetical protein